MVGRLGCTRWLYITMPWYDLAIAKCWSERDGSIGQIRVSRIPTTVLAHVEISASKR